ncbi:MAG: hypothetical protein KAT65_09170 [Methanophagales archaeon]|nr:hypothetical protein [Methanophagales archaeon]
MTNTNAIEGKEKEALESPSDTRSKEEEIKRADLNEVLKLLQESGILKEVPNILKKWSVSSSRRVLFEWITILLVLICASLLCYLGKISGEMTAVLFMAIIGYILGKKV